MQPEEYRQAVLQNRLRYVFTEEKIQSDVNRPLPFRMNDKKSVNHACIGIVHTNLKHSFGM